MGRPRDIAKAYTLSSLSAIGQYPGAQQLARLCTGLTGPQDRLLKWTMHPDLEPTDDWLRQPGLNEIMPDYDERWLDMIIKAAAQDVAEARQDTDRVQAFAYMLGSVGMVGVGREGADFLRFPNGDRANLAVVTRLSYGEFCGAIGTAEVTGADFMAQPTAFGAFTAGVPSELCRI